MKPNIENLKALVYRRDVTKYQTTLGMNEFKQLLDYIYELEQSYKHVVMQSEAYSSSDVAAVASEGQNEGNTCADCRRKIPIGEECYSCQYGEMFGH